ncbi:hypothetical protein [Halegenticoccus tardaugens]|uniref:hypothetical protein n=1 Tax=Halegenticoccus tardaugens TaxID=2071624 RepID=UPI00100AB8EE|nr:hypothetical protein [Halegenticoccus tardaugens]
MDYEDAPAYSTQASARARPGRPDRPAAGSIAVDATSTPEGGTRSEVASTAAHLAEQLCRGFVAHDDRDWGAAVRAFYEVDRRQFAHLTGAEAYEAARAYAAALWEKDDVEAPHVSSDGGVDREGLSAADWTPVEARLARRASIVGMERTYATETTAAWREHKIGGDYWTPTMRAQRIEIRAAIGCGEHPEKPRFGRSGFGHLAAYYLAGTELHDMHTRRHWVRAARIMAHYFEEILVRRAEASRETA